MNPILNSTITDMWKKEMLDTLMMVYGNKLDKNKLSAYLDQKIKNINVEPVCNIRNQYEFKQFTCDANDLTNIIRENNVSILGNGMMTYSVDERPALQTRVIEHKMKMRKYHKKLMLEAIERNDQPTVIAENNAQNKEKEETNSFYGVSTMDGSFVANIDCGSAITAQGRHLISETLWSVEKLIGNNYPFLSIGEYLLFSKKAISKELEDKDFDMISYIPTTKDCMTIFRKETTTIPKFNRDFNKTPKSFFIFMKSMTDKQRILYYYKNNIYDLIDKNPRIKELIINIANTNVTFENPYDIPDVLKPYINTLCDLMEKFVYVPTIAYKRLEKYQKFNRKSVLISDTDSIMPCVNQLVEFCGNIINSIGISMDIDTELRIVNVVITLIDKFIEKSCQMYVDTCNGSVDRRANINFKNELYYSSMIVFAAQKKIYSGLCLLQEGKRVPESKQLRSTGRDLNAASKCQEIMDQIRDIIEYDILRTKHIDIVKIIKKKQAIEDKIENDIKNGIMIYGEYAKYKNPEQYKNIFQTPIPRAAYIWDELYPEHKLQGGTGMYMFKTTLVTLKDFDKIQDEEMRRKCKDVIFNAYGTRRDESVTTELSKFGLKLFAVNEEYGRIPEWIIPFIDISDIKTKQMRTLTSLSPSLGLNIGSIRNSTQNAQTNLISF